MTPEKQRIIIAEACGWKNLRIERLAGGSHVLGKCPRDYTSSHGFSSPPDYLNDLNAMHEALSYVSKHNPEWRWEMFSYRLNEVLDRYHYDCDGPVFLATAAQIAEASLKTLDLWEESK